MFEFIVNIVQQGSYAGVFLLMALENLFPPIPSELIMPLAGFAAARGDMNVVLVVLAGTLGSVIGALPWYYAGKRFGLDRIKRLASRHGRWMTVSPDDVDTAMHRFERHGRAVVFFGRLIPAIRTLISVPAGINRMHMAPFLAFSIAGSLLWTGVLTAAGYVLNSQYERVAEYLDPVSKGVLILIVGIYVYRLVTHPAQRADGT
ncbi:DedA family protein [Noviherbaspirillum sp.]|uniref:DedA family protein n=1 Tax=Noviherbaspirillum sp. TaxID=1926288 RepID=UPI002FE2D4E3